MLSPMNAKDMAKNGEKKRTESKIAKSNSNDKKIKLKKKVSKQAEFKLILKDQYHTRLSAVPQAIRTSFKYSKTWH